MKVQRISVLWDHKPIFEHVTENGLLRIFEHDERMPGKVEVVIRFASSLDRRPLFAGPRFNPDPDVDSFGLHATGVFSLRSRSHLAGLVYAGPRAAADRSGHRTSPRGRRAGETPSLEGEATLLPPPGDPGGLRLRTRSTQLWLGSREGEKPGSGSVVASWAARLSSISSRAAACVRSDFFLASSSNRASSALASSGRPRRR